MNNKLRESLAQYLKAHYNVEMGIAEFKEFTHACQACNIKLDNILSQTISSLQTTISSLSIREHLSKRYNLGTWLLIMASSRECQSCELMAFDAIAHQNSSALLKMATPVERHATHKNMSATMPGCSGQIDTLFEVTRIPKFILDIGDVTYFKSDDVGKYEESEEVVRMMVHEMWEEKGWMTYKFCRSIAMIVLRWQIAAHAHNMPQVKVYEHVFSELPPQPFTSLMMMDNHHSVPFHIPGYHPYQHAMSTINEPLMTQQQDMMMMATTTYPAISDLRMTF